MREPVQTKIDFEELLPGIALSTGLKDSSRFSSSPRGYLRIIKNLLQQI